MHILGVGTANPPARYTKAECLAAFEKSAWFARLDGRAHFIARTVLQRDNGIEARRLAVDSLDQVFAINPNTLSERFLNHAPALAAQAGERALMKAGLPASHVDAVVVSTCTGYLCPGLSGHVVERLGLRPDVQAFDLVGQGCAAALPNLMLGKALLATQTCEHVLSICVEVSSAAMYLDNDPGVLISACLFGDGAGAAVLGLRGGASGRRIVWKDSTSLVEPGARTALMFEQRDGMLRNILTRAVPALAADYAQRVLGTVLGRAGLNSGDVGTWVMHAGGRDVLQALAQRLELPTHALRHSAAMLRGGMVIADGGTTTVACCVRRDQLSALRVATPGQRAADVVDAWLRRECGGVRRALLGTARDGPWLTAGPLSPGVHLESHDSIFRIGNAAGEAHPILGEGMSMALQSAALLSSVLLGRSGGAAVPDATVQAQLQRCYAVAWRKAFSTRLRLAAVFAHLAMRPRGADALMQLARVWPGLLTQGARWGGKIRLADSAGMPESRAGAEARPVIGNTR